MEEGVVMVSNCSLYPLEPLDPAVDPAYADGIPPRPHPRQHTGEIAIDWPVGVIPAALRRQQTISIEVLEDVIEQQAAREERYS
jgi:hypothetical protein